MSHLRNALRRFAAVAWAGALTYSRWQAPAAEILPPGFRPPPPGVHALTGGKVVVKPGEDLPNATILIRKGHIEAVGTNVTIPADARVWEMGGCTIYAGFIDACVVPDAAVSPVSTAEAFPVNEQSFAAGGTAFYGVPGVSNEPGGEPPANARIRPESRSIEKHTTQSEWLKPMRELGFTAGLLVPPKGILRGTSSVISLSDDSPNRTVIRPGVFQHISFDTTGNEAGAYPNSLMGIIACIRQTLLDAQDYALDAADYARDPGGRRRPELSVTLEALAPVLNRQTPVMFEPGSALMNSRAATLAQEFNLRFALISSGEEWRRPDLLPGIGATFVVPVNFPSIPKLPSEDDWIQVSLDQLRAWDWASENPALLRQNGREIAITTYGLSDRKSFRKNLQLALDRGLSEADALAGLTTVPARLCGVEQQLGTVETGKLANLVVVAGNYFDPEAKVQAVWIDGRIYQTGDDGFKTAAAGQTKPAVISDPDATPPKEEPEKHPRPPGAGEAAGMTNAPAELEAKTKEQPRSSSSREIHKVRAARSPLEGRGPLSSPTSLLIRGATLWTCGPQGILTNANVLVNAGRIQQAGHFKAEPGPNTTVIDGAGLHVTPGIVDCHSHAAILGNGNETGLPSTSMVRIGDVLNSETENLYRQLAGGVTTIQLLHGSANPIGGQSCVIKLRDGAAPDQLLFEQAPPGIKFALGENVKQANWGDKFTTRFPQTRMGVRTFIQNRFTAAQQYLRQWEDYRASTNSTSATAPVPPRRDLELEAIGEILRGKRWIHCHAYRQDEMLMLTRLMQEFRVQIATFQHALDAYKIADELAAADIGISAFSDWWGFKFELFDAIPYNGSLSRHRGVLVSFNSDFSELARRLYLEAAKAVKYGATPPEEALKFVTLNPAKQLRIDRFVGSIERGKDADFVVWSKSPLDSGTLCLQTWIDGRKYFDRADDVHRTERLKQERMDLIAKAKRLGENGAGAESGASGGRSFFHISLEHAHDEWSCGHE